MEKGSFKYACVLDKLKVEHEYVWYQYYISPWKSETTKYCVTTRDFMGNIITGTFQFDCAVLNVFAGAGEFEASISKNGQTCEHAKTKQKTRFKQAVLQAEKRGNGYGSQHLHQEDWLQSDTVTISVWNLDNMVETSVNMSWLKGWKVTCREGHASGTILLEALNCILPRIHPTDKPLQPPP